MSPRWPLVLALLLATAPVLGTVPPPCPAQILAGFPSQRVEGRPLRPRAIELADPAFRDFAHEDSVYQMYLASLEPDGLLPSRSQVRTAIETIAAEQDRSAALSFTNGFTLQSSVRTRAKIDLRTGDFLIVDHRGYVAAFTRLPLRRRPFGPVKDLRELADIFSSYAEQDHSTHPRLMAAEDLGAASFSPHNRASHFNKHVLGCPTQLPLRRWLELYKEDHLSRHSGFPLLQEHFARALGGSRFRRSTVPTVYKNFLGEYEKHAKSFLRSTSPTALSSTYFQRAHGTLSLITIKFDLQTLEFAILNRRDQTIVTYFRVTEMVPSNDHLHYRLRLPPVQTPLEYFLVLALADHEP